jgi:hypothetical protein
MRIRIFCLAALYSAFPTGNASAQDSIRTNVSPGQIDKHVTLLIPKGDLLIREQYRDWRSNFWFFWTDTVTPTDGGMLTGRLGTIDPKEFVDVESCDPVIRKIRNETLAHRLRYEHEDETEGLTPVLSANDSLAMPTREDETLLCPDAFAAKAQHWQAIKMAGMREALIPRSVRAEWVQSAIEKGRPEQLDSAFIKGFLGDFRQNPTDGRTFLLLAEHRTDALLEACNRLSKKHFRSVKFAVERSTKTLNTAAAMERLKASEVKGKRRRQLARLLERKK